MEQEVKTTTKSTKSKKTTKKTTTEENYTLAQKLLRIQNEINAPKTRKNSYGNYAYRNLEDILSAAKPVLLKYECLLTLNDYIEVIGNRYYIKAVATLRDTITGEVIEVSRMAREQENKKGMDEPQITGSASSYAGKYALNALFLIDDMKDQDCDEYRKECEERAKEEDKQKEKEALAQADLLTQRKTMNIKAKKLNFDVQKFDDLKLKVLGTAKPREQLTLKEINSLINALDELLQAESTEEN